jgi:carbon-monoxide dehydrogenase small subunit
MNIQLTVNGKKVSKEVEPRTLLVTFLREQLGLTGTHNGCDTGQCGACLVQVGGHAVKACLMLAAQANGAEIVTIEGLAPAGGLHPMQQAFRDHHGLQCGFCTPGMVIAAIELANSHRDLDEETIRHGLEGNLCRCTGYHNIVESVAAGAKAMKIGAGV